MSIPHLIVHAAEKQNRNKYTPGSKFAYCPLPAGLYTLNLSDYESNPADETIEVFLPPQIMNLVKPPCNYETSWYVLHWHFMRNDLFKKGFSTVPYTNFLPHIGMGNQLCVGSGGGVDTTGLLDMTLEAIVDGVLSSAFVRNYELQDSVGAYPLWKSCFGSKSSCEKDNSDHDAQWEGGFHEAGRLFEALEMWAIKNKQLIASDIDKATDKFYEDSKLRPVQDVTQRSEDGPIVELHSGYITWKN